MTRHTPQKSQKKIFNQLKLRLKHIKLKDAAETTTLSGVGGASKNASNIASVHSSKLKAIHSRNSVQYIPPMIVPK